MRIAQRIADRNRDPRGSRPVTMAFLGDSVTHGCFEIYQSGPREIEAEYRPSRAYHQLLKEMIESVFPACPVSVINAGVGGDSAKGGLKRLERDVISFQPDLAVVCFGLNDACGGKEKIGEYTQAMKGIFDLLRRADIEAVCLTPNMMGTRLLEEDTNPLIREVISSIIRRQNDGTMEMYMDALRGLCRKENVPLCDCYARWKKLSALGADVTRLLANHVNHPNEAMHGLFARALFDMIFGLVET